MQKIRQVYVKQPLSRYHHAYFAAGFGGQYIYVVPNLDLVVVITSDTDQAHIENRDLIPRFVLPAVVR